MGRPARSPGILQVLVLLTLCPPLPGFALEKVPPDLDAIVIGSGIGGLAVAAALAKAGKRVLVLEQHDQAGGCCHTFQEKGFEFDVGKRWEEPAGCSRARTSRELLDFLGPGPACGTPPASCLGRGQFPRLRCSCWGNGVRVRGLAPTPPGTPARRVTRCPDFKGQS